MILPELRAGRVRVAPDRADSRGVEMLLSSDDGALSWWVSYAYSEVYDVIAGDNVPLPFADALEQRVIPTVDKLVEAVRRLASY